MDILVESAFFRDHGHWKLDSSRILEGERIERRVVAPQQDGVVPHDLAVNLFKDGPGWRGAARIGASAIDYSLHDVASRPAKVGDKLVTTQFAKSITRGFSAVGEPNVAVCLLPGTEVAFEKEIECLGSFLNWKRAKRIGDKVARFRQVNRDQPHIHHDALEFPNGECVLLTRLRDGQFATVLQLPAAPRTVESSPETEAQGRLAYIG